MSYSSEMLRERVQVIEPFRVSGITGEATAWRWGAEAWAAVDWSRGTRAMRQGEVEAYDIVMIRMRWRPDIDRYCRLYWNGQYFTINSYYADKRENTIQITAVEVGPFTVMLRGAE